VPAMCSAPEPPVEEVQQTSASIVGLCQNLEFRPAPGQLKSLTFIKQSLLTFKQTFTEQITTFSQKMSDITGESVTAFSLGIQEILVRSLLLKRSTSLEDLKSRQLNSTNRGMRLSSQVSAPSAW